MNWEETRIMTKAKWNVSQQIHFDISVFGYPAAFVMQIIFPKGGRGEEDLLEVLLFIHISPPMLHADTGSKRLT